MIALNFRRRLAIIVSVFVIPVSVFGYLYLRQVNETIVTADKEQSGLRYLTKIWQVMIDSHRGSVKLAIGGSLEASLKTLTQDETLLEVDMQSGVAARKLIATMSARPGSLTGAASSAELDRFGGLAEVLYSNVSDASGITLDPELATYYLGDIITQRAPALASALRDVAMIAEQMRSNPGTMSADQVRLIATLQSLRMAYDQMQSDIGKALGGYDEGMERSALVTILGESRSQSERILGIANAIYINIAFGIDMDANLKEISRQSIDALRLFDRVWNVPASEMKRLLDLRTSRQIQQATVPVLAALTTFLIAILTAYYVARSILQGLETLTNDIKQAANGTEAKETPLIHVQSELGEIARAIELLKNSTVTRVNEQNLIEREAALKDKHREAMNVAATAIREATSGLIADLRKASSSLESTTASVYEAATDTQMQMEDTSSTLQMTVSNVETVAESSEGFSRSIAEITIQSNESSRIAQQVEIDASSVHDCVERLRVTTSRIGNIVSVISKISAQTNLLALNATIEAARAGDAGRGFSVVAMEVKQLAAQTEAATHDVGQQIENIQLAISEVFQTVQGIKEVVGRAKDVSLSIAGAIQEQSAVSDLIGDNIRKVASQTAQASLAIQEVTKLAVNTGARVGTLQSMSNDLKLRANDLERQVDDALQLILAA